MCDNYEEMISLYIDGELDENEEKELLEHLNNCPLCEKEYEELKAVKAMLDEIEREELPENFHNEVMAKIREQSAPKTVKKKRRWDRYVSLAASICALVVVGGVLGTGFFGMGSESAADAASSEMYYATNQTTAMKGEAVVEEYAAEETMDGVSVSLASGGTDTGAAVAEAKATADLKIIKSGSLEISVKNYDEAIEAIKNDVEGKNGYIESSNSYVYSNNWVNSKMVSLREGYLVLRVPAEEYENAFGYIKTLGEVSNEYESQDNITDSYIDTESRMLAKKTEEQRLIELLAKAENVDDIVTIEARLSEVRGEIESYESRLISWDKQVDYSTIDVRIIEDPDEKVENVSSDIGTKIKNSFVRGINNFIEGVEAIIISIAGNVIGIGIFIIAVVIIVVAVKKGVKKIKNKKDE